MPRPSIRIQRVTASELKDLIRTPRTPVTLVNVWATWCVPCVEEFPALMRVSRTYRSMGLKTIFVSADFSSNFPAVEEFLAGQGYEGTAYVKEDSEDEFIRSLSSDWSGSIPATFVFDSAGTLRRFREGKATEEEFTGMILDVLKNPNKTEKRREP